MPEWKPYSSLSTVGRLWIVADGVEPLTLVRTVPLSEGYMWSTGKLYGYAETIEAAKKAALDIARS